MCKSKLHGGMGFRNLEAFNLAMLAKQGWRMLSNPSSLVARVFKARYFPHDEILNSKKGNNPSYAWRSIHINLDVLRKETRWRVGNGRRIHIWEDKWLPTPTTYKVTSPPTDFEDFPMVVSLIDLDTRWWKADTVRFFTIRSWKPETSFALDVSYNKLSNKIPDQLGDYLSLETLYMQGNFFEGTIPDLRKLKGNQYLDLSHNILFGQIPSYMVNFPMLQNLNLSFNNLEGEVPVEGVFRNASAVEVYGNSAFCGGIQELHMQACPSQGSKKHRKHVAFKLILAISIAAAFCLTSISLFTLSWLRKSKKKCLSISSFGRTYQKISYEELLNATDGFSLRNLIGSGNFGSVYKGKLGLDEPTVAVKVLNLQKQGASKTFIAECEALRNIRHRNLVKIVTACSSIDFGGKDFKALVYEFMPNGSLEMWLHPEDELSQLRNLNLLQRMNIAIDVASALLYLHHHCQTPIIHCDLKPSNILLDDDLTAHVSDFGLARLLSKSGKEAFLNQLSSAGIKGTIGYVAPEYGMGS
ncbi:putative receptor-like protein kinase At3g47110 [Quercus lobata]|uniref:putative receptor-like protein kinase At3g47110 n=1 Tax=Quercus lobata TaxID=97700 RepID=UPI001247F6A0|nr:putative receptor-like protein kinase At3g47110 [Quercus lobata]